MSDTRDQEYPETLRYTLDHEWVEALDGAAGTVRIGITAFAQSALGDVVYVSLPAVGDTLTAGETCGEVESTKSVSDLFAPLSGEVTAVNTALDGAPELVNSAPYADGWMYELKVAGDASAALDGLMDVSTYRQSVG
ncbi:MAG: glycine cleavage system protein GcvH [Lapillicoccus sp.]